MLRVIGASVVAPSTIVTVPVGVGSVVPLAGAFAVTAMLACYALGDRSQWCILAVAAACGLGSAYGLLQGAWPVGLVEAIWAVVALRRWSIRRR